MQSKELVCVHVIESAHEYKVHAPYGSWKIENLYKLNV